MTPQEAVYALDKAGKLHAGQISLPPHIIAMKQLIADKTRNAEQFAAKFNLIDQGMINEIVALKRQLDGLYAQWGLE